MKNLILFAPLALLAGCITPPPAPAAPYHAHGSQPSWTLIIDEQHVTYIRADQSVLREPITAPVLTTTGSSYRTPRISVAIVHAQCSDGASGRIYPDRVQVHVDGRAFHGCGGR